MRSGHHGDKTATAGVKEKLEGPENHILSFPLLTAVLITNSCQELSENLKKENDILNA